MKCLPVLSLAVLLSLSTPSASHAQVLYGSLAGNVTDASGAAVAGAKVEALHVAVGISKRAICDDHGAYVINDLQPGVYRVCSPRRRSAT